MPNNTNLQANLRPCAKNEKNGREESTLARKREEGGQRGGEEKRGANGEDKSWVLSKGEGWWRLGGWEER